MDDNYRLEGRIGRTEAVREETWKKVQSGNIWEVGKDISNAKFNGGVKNNELK